MPANPRKRASVLRALTAFCVALGVIGIGAGFVACVSNTAATGITPITGVVIRSASLIAGHGCGTGSTQVYKYLAIVANKNQQLDQNGQPPQAYAQVFDCFADGVFVNLTASPSGSLDFYVEIFAYNQDDYAANATRLNDIVAAPPEIPEGGRIPSPPPSTWFTTCEAKQQQDIIVLAVCDPLTGGPVASDGGDVDSGSPDDGGTDASVDAGIARIIVNTDRFARIDGGDYVCNVDAGDAGNYEATRIFYAFSVDGGPIISSQTGRQSCAQPQVFSPARANAAYSFDVKLEIDAAVIGSPQCRATAIPGQTVIATCDPAP